MHMKDLNYYVECFSSLHTMKKCGKPAPHKALLLLSVIDLVERGFIVDNRIYLSDELICQFNKNVVTYLGDSILFQPKIVYPFYHMGSERFWRIVYNPKVQVEKITNYSLANLRQKIAYASIDEELFVLLQNPNIRARLRVVLIANYLDNQPTVVDILPQLLLAFSCGVSLIA